MNHHMNWNFDVSNLKLNELNLRMDMCRDLRPRRTRNPRFLFRRGRLSSPN